MQRSSSSLRCVAGALFVFLYAPIAVVVVYSFNAAKFGGDLTGFTLHWYAALFENAAALAAAKNTLALAVTSTAISTGLGTLLGFGLSRYRFPGQRSFNRLLYVPVFIPDIVMAVSLLLFFALVRSWSGWFELGLGTMVIAHVTFQIPFVAIVVRARLAGLDPAIEEAAHDLGADAWRTLRHVTLPLIFPGVLAAAMLAFTLSLDDFVVSFLTSGPGSTTLPIYIYSSVKRGVTPDINALSTLIVAVSVTATLGVSFLQRKQQARVRHP
jgi:spermidine/putrescine transport system permease protein